jgi:HSP20 family protein
MLVKYRPFDTSLDLVEQAFDRFFHEGAAARPWTPPVDIVETENAFVLTADAPALDPEKIEVQFENGTLTIKGAREFEKKHEGKGYHRIERSYGAFTRAFTLPETVDPEKLTADYKDGVLTVSIAKKEIAKPRAVKVNVHAK